MLPKPRPKHTPWGDSHGELVPDMRKGSELHVPVVASRSQIAPMDVAHVTRIEGPDDNGRGQQLTLTLITAAL